MKIRPMMLCTTEAVTGAPDDGEVRPRALGSTRSRPSAKPYRATVLWNEIIAASTEVTKSVSPMSTQVLPRFMSASAKMVPGPASWVKATMLSGPVATDIAHDDRTYTAATMTIEM